MQGTLVGSTSTDMCVALFHIDPRTAKSDNQIYVLCCVEVKMFNFLLYKMGNFKKSRWFNVNKGQTAMC
jgi:hypothetical protein